MNFEMMAAQPLKAETITLSYGQDRPDNISLATDSN